MTARCALAVAVLITSCAYNAPRVPVQGTPADLEALAGRWTGEYRGETTARSGTITFALVAGEDHAHGEVVMMSRSTGEPYVAWRDPGAEHGRVPTSEVLTIRFVAAESGEITGELDRYLDPECRCAALTRFRGRQHGELIEGTYTTRRQGSSVADQGVWTVLRARAKR
jgi:hypothetical protein